jgi:hypothetical protein
LRRPQPHNRIDLWYVNASNPQLRTRNQIQAASTQPSHGFAALGIITAAMHSHGPVARTLPLFSHGMRVRNGRAKRHTSTAMAQLPPVA